MKTPVLIAGGGPVGLCLAIDLADRGIEVIVAEIRYAGEPPSVKCNHVSSRTMETFRRMGFADQVRKAGLPDDYPNDIVFRNVAVGKEFARIHIPCRNDRLTDKSGPDGWWPTPEPPHRVNQIFLEPILFEQAQKRPNITLLNRTKLTEFSQNDDKVCAITRNLDTGELTKIEADFIVGCDGGKSQIRKSIGGKFIGDAVIQRVQSTYFHSPELINKIQQPHGWMTYLYHPKRAATLLAIDGKNKWLMHNYLLPNEENFESVDRDATIRMILGVDKEFEITTLNHEDWIGRRLISDKFREGRVFLCGDSAHIWVPYAGYGMNAGIADAMGLSWTLAAHIKGWGGTAMIDAYEQERQPITEQVSRFAMSHAEKAIKERLSTPTNVLEDTPEAANNLKQMGEKAYELHVQQFACAGLNYGYYYENSDLIEYDKSDFPEYSMYDYTPSTVPGCRLPHIWLSDGRSLYDHLGEDYTLLRFDPSLDFSSFLQLAKKLRIPLKLLDIDSENFVAPYEHKLTLSRPDRHVAWRGNALPTSMEDLLNKISGNTVKSTAPC